MTKEDLIEGEFYHETLPNKDYYYIMRFSKTNLIKVCSDGNLYKNTRVSNEQSVMKVATAQEIK